HMPCVRPLPEEYNSPQACNAAASCPTLRTGVRGMYLTAPLDAQARSKVHTGLLSRLTPDLVGPLYGDAMAVLARIDRRPWQPSHLTRHYMPRVHLPSASLSPILGFQERTAENRRSASNTPRGSHDKRRGCYGQSFAGSREQRRLASTTGCRVAYRAGLGPRGAQPGPGR